MKAIKRIALVLLFVFAASCAGIQVPATNLGPLPPKDTFVFVSNGCGGTNLAIEGTRILAVTATHCFEGNTFQVHDANWDSLGEGEVYMSVGDVAYFYYYPKHPEAIAVALLGEVPIPGDALWYYGYNFTTNSFMPTVAFFTPETTTYEGNTFYILSGPVIHGFSGTGVFRNGKLVGVVNIGMFGLVARQANWTGIQLLKDIPYEYSPEEEAASQLAPPYLPFLRQPDRV